MASGVSALRARLGGASFPLRAFVGAALVLLGIGTVVVSTAFNEPQTAERDGSNLPINEGASDPLDIRAHNSPSLVRNPVEPGNLVVTDRIDSPRFSCALHVSFDGGAKWRQIAVPAPEGERLCFAPDVAFGGDGTLYLSFVTLRGRANAPNAGWVVTSKDGGKTFSVPVKALGKNSFQVRVVADPKKPGRVYLTWVQASELGLYKFTEAGNPIRAVRSDDAGVSWEQPTQVSEPERERVVAPSTAIGPKGELYALYLDLGEDVLDYQGAHGGRGGPPYQGRWQLVFARSTDGARSWEESVVEERLVPSERFIVFTPPFPSVAVDQEDGRVFAGFHDGRLGDQDVWVWSLPSGEESWGDPTRVNDTPERDKSSQYLPKLAVAPGGRLDVLYYDRRADPNDQMNEVSLQSSSDEGETFGRRVRVSDGSFSSEIGNGSERGLPDLGSRLGLVSDDSGALAAWTDTRGGTVTSNKQDIARAVVLFSDPGRLSKPVEYLLRFGGIVLALIGIVLLVTAALSRGTSGSSRAEGLR